LRYFLHRHPFFTTLSCKQNMQTSCVLLFLLALGTSAAAQTKKPDTATNQDLKGLNRQIQQSTEREGKIANELTALEREAKEISERLIALASKTQTREANISIGLEKIATLNTTEKQLIASLNVKRDALGELLVGLQRLEGNPPPPLAAHPSDALAAIRSATLFGSIIPAIKAETTILRRELAKLQNVRQKLKIAQSDLQKDNKTLDSVRQELRKALALKKSFVKKTQQQLKNEHLRTAALAQKARNLKDLIARIKKQKQRQEQQRLLAEKQKTAEERRKEAARKARLLRPKVIFSKAVGALKYPAQGSVLRNYNEKGALGSRSKGVFLATLKHAQVTAPSDAVVEFAGEFRSYGQLLILNVGQGYHMLLGGLEKIDVQTGQRVFAGEPIGTMGTSAARKTLITASLDVNKPVLYIEFRKNGGSIDPTRWWNKNLKRARN